jgi:hypothetical protein
MAKFQEVSDKYQLIYRGLDGRLHLDYAALKSHRRLIQNDLGIKVKVTLSDKVKELLGL